MPVGPGGDETGMATPAYVLPQLYLTLMALSPLFLAGFLQIAVGRPKGHHETLHSCCGMPLIACQSQQCAFLVGKVLHYPRFLCAHLLVPDVRSPDSSSTYFPRLCGPHYMMEEEERRRSLLVTDQRTMSSLFSLLRSVSSRSYVT